VTATTRPGAGFMLRHPAHIIALGCGSGLSPVAPGTAGTLWAWVAFLVFSHWGFTNLHWAWLIFAGIPVGWWASTVTARHMGVLDPGSIVWDEIIAFWLVLWLVMPTGFWGQFVAFALFRFFDAVKPGPVAWADQLFHGVDTQTDRFAWIKAGFGIMFDDLVAAACTLLVIALWRFL
jgi:phosphatidylglycerophosphatase A